MERTKHVHGIEIPKIIHQTWKTATIPAKWEYFQRSWQEHHPTWEYRFWTDEMNRGLIAQEYSWFLPIYDSYTDNIKRADAIRYFYVYHFGGVYVDLDFQCLKPLDELLGGQELVMGWEPAAHVSRFIRENRGLNRIICNAFLASKAAHPFWEDVFKHLVESKDVSVVLDATGPFLLTHAYNNYPNAQSLTIVPSDLLYPISSEESRQKRFKINQICGIEKAYAIHYWSGSWFRETTLKAVHRRILKSREQK
jgi:mannosyltransferase OCH1-like enzyme